MKKRGLVVGVMLCMVVACQSFARDEESPAGYIPPITPTIPTNPTATFPPLATNTPNVTFVEPTLAPQPTGYPPATFGGRDIGLSLNAPESWADVSSNLPNVTTSHLLIASDKQAGNRVTSGKSLGPNAFIFAYIPPSTQPVSNPVQALRLYLDNHDPVENPTVVPVTINQVSGAYVDIEYDALGILPHSNAPRHYRLLLLIQPTTDKPVLFQFGTSTANWSAFHDLFGQIMSTIVLYDVLADSIPGLPTPPITQAQLENGIPAGGTLTADISDLWTFDGVADSYATLVLQPQESGLDLTLTLLTPAGETLTRADFGFTGDTETLADIHLPETGRYIVLVQEFFNMPGAYQLHLTLSNTPQFNDGGAIGIGQVLVGQLPNNGEQVWTFSGQSDQIISIVLTPNVAQFDAILELYDPTGAQLVSLDEGFSGDAEVIAGFPLPLTGTYAIHISGFGGSGGEYNLSLAEGGNETANFYDAGDLYYGETRREKLRANEAHAWFFEGLAGDEITIVVSPLDTKLDMHIWLLDPNVERLSEADQFLAGQAEIIHYALPSDGLFVILVQEFFGESGDYDISLSYSGNDSMLDGGMLAYGDEVTEMLVPGRATMWHINTNINDIITFDLSPVETGDLVLMLRDPYGNLVLVVNDHPAGEAERLPTFTATIGGTWTIIVRENRSLGSQYTLTVDLRD